MSIKTHLTYVELDEKENIEKIEAIWLEKAKEGALEALDKEIASHTYRNAEQKKIDTLVEEYKALINEEADRKNVETIKGEYLSKIKDIKTAEQYEAEEKKRKAEEERKRKEEQRRIAAEEAKKWKVAKMIVNSSSSDRNSDVGSISKSSSAYLHFIIKRGNGGSENIKIVSNTVRGSSSYSMTARSGYEYDYHIWWNLPSLVASGNASFSIVDSAGNVLGTKTFYWGD